MLSKDLQRHSGEFAKAIKGNQFEVTPDGVYFPAAKQLVKVGVRYKHSINGVATGEFDDNLVPLEGRLHALSVALGVTAKVATWYLAPFTGNATPIDSWTAANFSANATENTSNTEGYSQTTRRAFTPNAAAGTGINSVGLEATFNIVTAGAGITFYGVGLLSTNVKGDTAGVLISAARFSAAKIVTNTDVWGISHEVTATST